LGGKGEDLASLAKKKNEEAMWGTSASSTAGTGNMAGGVMPPRPSAPTPRTASQQPQLGGGLDDLLG
jgi:hypothetical protein